MVARQEGSESSSWLPPKGKDGRLEVWEQWTGRDPRGCRCNNALAGTETCRPSVGIIRPDVHGHNIDSPCGRARANESGTSAERANGVIGTIARFPGASGREAKNGSASSIGNGMDQKYKVV